MADADTRAAILDDPAIDAVYIPLPIGLHMEWALKALAKGKHVLLEKASVSNAAEAEMLFASPLATGPDAPVLLEAFHYRFQPTWKAFLELVDRPSLAEVHAQIDAPAMMFAKDDIRFRYDLGGGAMMDAGTYTLSVLRQVAGAEPLRCASCAMDKLDSPNELCDYAARATFVFPGDVTGVAVCSLRGRSVPPAIPLARAKHRPVVLPAAEAVAAVAGHGVELGAGYECTVAREVTLHNFVMSALWHRIDIDEEFVVQRPAASGAAGAAPEVVKRWRKKTSKKVYTFKDMGDDQPGEPYWVSYRHQLEQFVNRIRKREGSGIWVSAEDSIAQMRMLDMAYEASDLPVRPTSKYRPPQA